MYFYPALSIFKPLGAIAQKNSNHKELHLSEIFKKTDDYNEWDKYINYFEQINIPDDDKKSIINAIIYLKLNFPKGFLRNGKEHRIRKILINFTQFNRLELVWISESLKLFKDNNSNYSVLLNKIINLKNSEIEGFPFLKIGSLFKKYNYEVLFEKSIENFSKKPDLIAKNKETLEKIYIEISTINQSDIINIRRSNYSRISNILHFNNVRFSGKICDEINENDLSIIEIKLQKLIEKCKSKNTIEFLYIKDRIDIAVCSNKKIDLLKKWQENKKYEIENLISLSLDFSRDIYRISNNKLKKEAKQIPSDEIGFIVLKTYPYFIMFDNNIEEAIRKFKKELKKYPHILGLVIYSNIVTTENDFERFYDNNCYYSIKSEFDINKMITLFVLNDNFQNPIKKKTFESIYNMFTNKEST